MLYNFPGVTKVKNERKAPDAIITPRFVDPA